MWSRPVHSRLRRNMTNCACPGYVSFARKMGRYAFLFEHVPARRDKPARVLDFNSIQDVHHYHRGFLADGEHVAQISLSLGEIGLGLCTGTTQGSKLGLDLILVGVLVLESGSKIAEFELDIGLRLALVRAAWPVALVWWAAWAATIGRPTAGPTWAAAIRSAWATEASGSTGSARATHTAAAGVALKLRTLSIAGCSVFHSASVAPSISFIRSSIRWRISAGSGGPPGPPWPPKPPGPPPSPGAGCASIGMANIADSSRNEQPSNFRVSMFVLFRVRSDLMLRRTSQRRYRYQCLRGGKRFIERRDSFPASPRDSRRDAKLTMAGEETTALATMFAEGRPCVCQMPISMSLWLASTVARFWKAWRAGMFRGFSSTQR